MEYKITQLKNKNLVESLPDGGMVTDEASALDIVAICGEEQTNFVLLYAGNFNQDFFDLKTGLAGQVLLKLSNYQIHAAAILPTDQIGTGRFYEMVIETNRRNDFRVYQNREDAIQWFEQINL
jgi:PadR family transcriptional regulator, regulatory protein AphA